MSVEVAGSVISLTRHEIFWIEVIRAASKDTDPTPTLQRTQKLRALFSTPTPASWREHEVNDGH